MAVQRGRGARGRRAAAALHAPRARLRDGRQGKGFGVAARVCGAALAACASVLALASAALQNDVLKVSRHVFSTALPRLELLRACAVRWNALLSFLWFTAEQTLAVCFAFYFTGFDGEPREVRPILVSALLVAY
eukprot:TRINITY_DN696_c0_g2_i1.p2 TRINITY_DN696_c0_g2~~TRINITY_DN696_c0_g2_i1.p2  ORF type:complete len:134 (-),score=24.66 TRINITY_DN696_c0_g2_i1:125-526(-)